MPAMPRFNKKATKIAFALLGKPANLQKRLTYKDSKVKQRLVFEETARIR